MSGGVFKSFGYKGIYNMANEKKLGFLALSCLILGAMIGGGIFALPQTIAASAQTGAILIAWIITGLGMLGLTFVFRFLTEKRPDLDGGIYSYAREGFGFFTGFISAWGYWSCAWIGNVSYAVLMFGALGYFLPIFGQGNTLWAVLLASVFLWGIHALVWRGVKEAATVNIVTTIAKILPIVVFILLCIPAFHWQHLTGDFWGTQSLGSVLSQVKSTMLVTLWGFIGIEGAVVVSARAKRKKDVARATLFALLLILVLYVMVSFLSLGILGQAKLSTLDNPSMAYVLQSVVGRWGAIFINLGLIVSLAGAWLGWTVLSAELPEVAAKDHTFPKKLAKENKYQSPAGALWLTNGLIQILLLIVFFSHGTYLTLLKLSTSCVLLPYLFSSLFALKMVLKKNEKWHLKNCLSKNVFFISLGALYSIFLIYSAGIHYLFLGAILYCIGIPLYIYSRKEANQRILSLKEGIFLGVILAAALVGIITLL